MTWRKGRNAATRRVIASQSGRSLNCKHADEEAGSVKPLAEKAFTGIYRAPRVVDTNPGLLNSIVLAELLLIPAVNIRACHY
jgi:hypothetical protein